MPKPKQTEKGANAGSSKSKTGAPSSKSSSRKSKAAWRKAIDLSAVEQHLEDQRQQERLVGTSGTDQGAFFTEDRQGDDEVAKQIRNSRAGKRPLKSLEILQSKSAVPAFNARARPSGDANTSASSNGKTALEQRLKKAGLTSKAAKDKLRRLANKTVKGPLGGILDSEQSRLQDIEGVQQVAAEDLWSTSASTTKKGKRKAADEEWLETAEQRQVKLPKTFATSEATPSISSRPSSHKVVQLSRSLPAVPLPHPGSSYNPDVDSHEALLQLASHVERAKEVEEEALRRFKKQWDELRKEEKEAVLRDQASKKVYSGMQVDVPEESEEEDASEDEAEDADADDAKKEPKRKTKAQRARAERAKLEVREAQERRSMKKLRHLMTQLPALRKQLETATKERAAAAELKREAQEERIKQVGMQGQKVGKNVVPTDLDVNHTHVQLGEDLTENLRSLKTEGNLFKDRFQRMQTRALAEPRKPVTAKRARGARGLKEYETHSYKHFS